MNNFKYMNKLFDTFKIVIGGEPEVGKSNLQFECIEINKSKKYITTHHGADFQIKFVKIGEKLYKLIIWDIQNFHSIFDIPPGKFHQWHRDTHGVILMYDITNENSFKSIREWCKYFDRNMPYKPCKVLVGNKCDKSNRVITEEEGMVVASDFNMKFFETSAENNKNINEVFECILQECIKAKNDGTFNIKHKVENITKKEEPKNDSCNII